MKALRIKRLFLVKTCGIAMLGKDTRDELRNNRRLSASSLKSLEMWLLKHEKERDVRRESRYFVIGNGRN